MDLSSALRRTPGVQVARFGPVGCFGGGEVGAVYLRGRGASRPGSEIKTYVDGLSCYSAVWNHALRGLLPVQGMERIVVHKGPQPQSFGKTFGAIDLQPRRATRPGLRGELRLSGGIVPPLAGAPDSWKTLAPERMDHVELGLHRAPARDSSVDLAHFDAAPKHRCVFAFPPALAQPGFTNLSAYKLRGVELPWQQRCNASGSGFAGATLLDSSLADLPYAPEQALVLGLTGQQGAGA